VEIQTALYEDVYWKWVISVSEKSAGFIFRTSTLKMLAAHFIETAVEFNCYPGDCNMNWLRRLKKMMHRVQVDPIPDTRWTKKNEGLCIMRQLNG
jgi:hypothetical protein